MKTHKRLSEAATEPVDKQTRTRPKGLAKSVAYNVARLNGLQFLCCNSCTLPAAAAPVAASLVALIVLLLHGNGTLPFRSFSCIHFDSPVRQQAAENIAATVADSSCCLSLDLCPFASSCGIQTGGHWHWLN